MTLTKLIDETIKQAPQLKWRQPWMTRGIINDYVCRITIGKQRYRVRIREWGSGIREGFFRKTWSLYSYSVYKELVPRKKTKPDSIYNKLDQLLKAAMEACRNHRESIALGE